MNILLLGATGYLGKNIYYYLNRKHTVYCLTRNGIVRNVDDISKTDIIYENLEEAIDKVKFDWLINSVGAYDNNQNGYKNLIDANYYFPFSVFDITIKNGIKNYINIGTSLPSSVGLYSLIKNQLSEIMEGIALKEKINFANLRLEMFYGGEYVGHKTFFDSIVSSMRKNEIIDVTDGEQRRDIIRVEDVVRLIETIINSDYISGYMNLDVGSGENAKMREIEVFLKELCKSESVIRFGAIPKRENEPSTLSDISWYKNIGFQLQYSFWEGLEDYYGNK